MKMQPIDEEQAKGKICPVMSGHGQRFEQVGQVSCASPEVELVTCKGSRCMWWRTTEIHQDRKSGACMATGA